MNTRLQLRPLLADDHAAVQALFARQGWPQRSRAGWAWALFDAPERRASGAPAGWVLVAPTALVGFLGNLPQRLWCSGQPVPAATCTALLVDADWRGQGSALLRAFSTQAGPQLLYSATANPLSAPLYRMFRYGAQAEAGLDQQLRWVADGRAFVAQALRHLLGRQPVDSARPASRNARPAAGDGGWLLPGLARLGWPSAWGNDTRNAWSGQVLRWQPDAPGTPQGDHSVRPPLAAAWQAWWTRMLAAHPGLLADRQQATLAWRLADPDLADDLAAWLLLDAQGAMQGLALARAVAPARAAPRAELLDWCLLPGTPPAGQGALLGAVGRWAAGRGLPFLEAKRFSGLAHAQLSALGPRALPLPTAANWCLLAGSRGAGQPLAPAGWSMAGIDSDDWFCSHRHTLPAADGPGTSSGPRAGLSNGPMHGQDPASPPAGSPAHDAVHAPAASPGAAASTSSGASAAGRVAPPALLRAAR